METTSATTAHTVVATFRVPDGIALDSVLAAITAQLEDVALIPCNWSPDPDTIADQVGVEQVIVHDLNPARV